MRLEVNFDEANLRAYDQRGASPVFAIFWSHEGFFYPHEGWVDFGSAILSFWTVAAIELQRGAYNAELDFMDGPFKLLVSRFGDILTFKAEDGPETWTSTKEEFYAELLNASQKTYQKLQQLNIAALEQASLLKRIELLKALFPA